MSQIPIAEPLVQVKRGSITESRHRGHVVAVEPDGTIVASLGFPPLVTFPRSSAKPFQALPLLADAGHMVTDAAAVALALAGGEGVAEGASTSAATAPARTPAQTPSKAPAGRRSRPGWRSATGSA